MPLLKKKTESIPPVSPAVERPQSFRSNASTYVASRDGDPYNNNSSSPSLGRYGDDSTLSDKYSRGRNIGDTYSRGKAELEQDRNELFSGYNPAKAGSGRFFDGPNLPQRQPGEENEEDIEGIKQQTRFVKQESVASTRSALRMAQEAEETARNTVTRLGDQSGMTSISSLQVADKVAL